MRAWRVGQPGPMRSGPLVADECPDPGPGRGEVLLKVRVCGVCRTDLHLAEGDLAPRHPGVIPGHEVVGEVIGCGPARGPVRPGDRVGVAWLGGTCGACRFCLRGPGEPLPLPRVHRLGPRRRLRRTHHGGRELRLPAPVETSRTRRPRRCCAPASSATGRSARAELPIGGRLGIYGFGGSAHLAAQIALYRGARVYVMTRSAEARALALELGATFAGGADEQPPDPLDSAILFAPAGGLVPVALRALDRGGTLAVAGIHLSDIPPLHYADELFQERQLRSVTANTRADGEEFFRIAAEIPLRPTTVSYPFSAADQALLDLSEDRITGAAVLRMDSAVAGTVAGRGPRHGRWTRRGQASRRPEELVFLAGPEQHLLDVPTRTSTGAASPGAADTRSRSRSEMHGEQLVPVADAGSPRGLSSAGSRGAKSRASRVIRSPAKLRWTTSIVPAMAPRWMPDAAWFRPGCRPGPRPGLPGRSPTPARGRAAPAPRHGPPG